MESTAGHILQFSDLVSTRKCALRIAPEDTSLPLGALLEKYLKHAPIQLLLRESGITQYSADALYAIQDLVYASSDSGQLTGMFPGVAFKEDGEDGRFLQGLDTSTSSGDEISRVPAVAGGAR